MEAKHEDTKTSLDETYAPGSNYYKQKENLRGSVNPKSEKNQPKIHRRVQIRNSVSQNPYNILPLEHTSNEDLDPYVLTNFTKLWDKYIIFTG